MKDLFKNIKFLWKYLKYQKLRMFGTVVFNLLQVVISVIVPILSAKIILNLTNNNYIQLVAVAAIVLGVELSRDFLMFWNRKLYQKIHRETLIILQKELGIEMLKLSNKSLDDNGTGVFIQRITNDTNKIADVFNTISWNLENVITNIGVFGAIFVLNKWVFLFVIIQTLIIFAIQVKRTNEYNKNDKICRKKGESVTSFISELVRGMRDIKMLNSEKTFIEEFENKSIDLNNAKYHMNNVNRLYALADWFASDIGQFLLIVLIVELIISGNLTAASALIAYNYSSRVTDITYFVSQLMDTVKDFNLSCNRTFSIIDGKEFKKEKFGNKHLDNIEGNFEFKNVNFAYKSNKILKDLSFKIKSGETVAFVGKSGAGKTTIFNLLCKMYNVKNDSIFIDGEDINKLDKDSIRGNITIISQNPYIFNLSIKDNLRLVKENLTDKEMVEACKLACLDDFIKTLPNKYDTIIGEGGVNLSGGQKQRLAIARALIQKTKIILFDEATSALDNETQSKIQEAIDNMKGEYTILIIAHRLSTIVNADRILVLNDGKIEAEGNHKELLKKSPEYKRLYTTEIESDE